MIIKIFEFFKSKKNRVIIALAGVFLLLVIAVISTWLLTMRHYKNNPIVDVKEKIVEIEVPGEEIVVEKEMTISAETIESGLQDVGVLSSAEYYFTHVIKDESQLQINDVDIPLTDSYCIYSYDGVVTAGIDFTEIEVTVDEDSRTIRVSLPEVKILGCQIDEESFKLYDEKSNIFNPMKIEDYADSYSAMVKDEEQKAVNRGILKEAEKNAKTLINEFMKGLYDVNGYQVIIATSDHK